MSQYEKMTQTPVQKLIAKLAVPTILTMLVTNIYNMADTAFVGTLGNSASGAVGVVFGFMSILQAIGFLFGQGSGSILSRKLGQQDMDGASRIASTGFFSAFFLSIAAALICFLCLDPLVIALGSTKTIAPYAKTYITYILCAAPFLVTSFTMNNILRFEGKAALGMIGMMTGGILNIFGDFILMIVFDMGIAGAGLSTALSQVVSFCILLSMFLRKKTQTRLSFRRITRVPSEFLDIAGTGMPSLLRQGLNSLATVVLNTQAAIYGDEAVAAMSIVSRVSMFVFSVALGIGQGFQPVSAFNYGAGKYTRVRKAFRVTFFMAEVAMCLLALFVLAFSGQLVQLFRDDPTVIEIGTRALRLHCAALLFLPFCMVTEMQLQSTGQKLGASVLSMMRGGILFIPLLLILAKLRGLQGIQEAQPLAYLLSVLPSVAFAVWFFHKLPKQDTE